MARPTKQGLDYFPLDVTWDVKMQLVKARFGLLGIGCIIELYKTIYKEGYALKWDEDTRLLFSSDNHIDEETLSAIISFAVSKGIFHAGKLGKLGVLTSSGIQKRWLRIAKDSGRSIKLIDSDLDLLTNPELSAQKTELSAQTIIPSPGLSVPEMPQSIVKKSIEEQSKERREDPVFNPPLETSLSPKENGAARIDKARSEWNTLAPSIGPPCRLIAITFRPEDASDCLRTMTSYTDAEIIQAMHNYHGIRESPEHEIKSPYQSFVGFVRGGVEKFIDEAEPWTRCKKPEAEQTGTSEEQLQEAIARARAEVAERGY
ncbi:hypothetical protein CCP3SC15_2750007 [Gammaproteobacteria bacterium]